ncbi:VOC family protein [Paenibacillus qinlingensis]|uniref:PhnB protein n=1 Tax=Paenibacillus qinlingensis TaxID=1837343 RepID=A0ABU1P095_9BACL|nr:VOC family protein [Paenibacillus qinlingensis]MDR6552517.1 PhnB protein [Paenibacillus qinlingensis]
MATLSPYIYSANAREQADFYVGVFGGEITNVQSYGDLPGMEDSKKHLIMHLEIQALGLRFFMADAGAEANDRGTGMDLALTFRHEEEAASIYSGLAKDGEVIMPFERMFWGTMLGRVRDRYGVLWQVATEA